MKFLLQGKLSQFTFLPNGSCSGPKKFTKLLKPPLAPLRLDYIKIVGYIDDLIIGRVYSAGKNFTGKINPALILPVKLKFYRKNKSRYYSTGKT